MSHAGYALVTDPIALDRAIALARGCYQRAILDGSAPISGAGLQGMLLRDFLAIAIPACKEGAPRG